MTRLSPTRTTIRKHAISLRAALLLPELGNGFDERCKAMLAQFAELEKRTAALEAASNRLLREIVRTGEWTLDEINAACIAAEQTKVTP